MKNAPLRIAQVAPLWTRIPPATYGGIELLMKLLIDELMALPPDERSAKPVAAKASWLTYSKLQAVIPQPSEL